MKQFTDRMTNRHPTHEVLPMWDVDKIEAYFNSKTLPETLKLDSITTITNVKDFISSHIEIIRYNATKPAYYPYYERLLKLTKLL